jgi:hypothetical protein
MEIKRDICSSRNPYVILRPFARLHSFYLSAMDLWERSVQYILRLKNNCGANGILIGFNLLVSFPDVIGSGRKGIQFTGDIGSTEIVPKI